MSTYIIGKSTSDVVLTEIVQRYEVAFPARIRGYYLLGSYVDGYAVAGSDIDLYALFVLRRLEMVHFEDDEMVEWVKRVHL